MYTDEAVRARRQAAFEQFLETEPSNEQIYAYLRWVDSLIADGHVVSPYMSEPR